MQFEKVKALMKVNIYNLSGNYILWKSREGLVEEVELILNPERWLG